MYPFSKYDMSSYFENKRKDIHDYVEKFTNDEIMGNDLNILADNCYNLNYIELLKIDETSIRKELSQNKIKPPNDAMSYAYFGKTKTMIDGFDLFYNVSFTGDSTLFNYRASTFTYSPYPNIELHNNSFTLHYSIPIAALVSEEDTKRQENIFSTDLKMIKNGISYINNDIQIFNKSLRSHSLSLFTVRQQKVKQFYSVSKMLNISIEKTEYAKNVIAVERRIYPTNKKFNKEDVYSISDTDYNDILMTIKHNCSTYERTPASFKALKEEDIRNLLLASLNGFFKGNATGEAFRNKGKTDICIEYTSRAAFVAECKIWNGKNQISDTLKQLDSYLTWRDCKTAILYFVRNRDFFAVLNNAKTTLEDNANIKNLTEIDRNEFELKYVSEINPGQYINIRFFLFNLYSQ